MRSASLSDRAPVPTTIGRPEADAPQPAASPSIDQLQQEVAELRHELALVRALRQRDQATARGMGVALQQMRRGTLALREENEELRRAAAAGGGTRRR